MHTFGSFHKFFYHWSTYVLTTKYIVIYESRIVQFSDSYGNKIYKNYHYVMVTSHNVDRMAEIPFKP